MERQQEMWGRDGATEVAIFGDKAAVLHVLQLMLSSFGYRASIVGETELGNEGRLCEFSLLILAPRISAETHQRLLSRLDTPCGRRLPRLELIEGQGEDAEQPGNSVRWPCCSEELHRGVRQALRRHVEPPLYG